MRCHQSPPLAQSEVLWGKRGHIVSDPINGSPSFAIVVVRIDVKRIDVKFLYCGTYMHAKGVIQEIYCFPSI